MINCSIFFSRYSIEISIIAYFNKLFESSDEDQLKDSYYFPSYKYSNVTTANPEIIIGKNIFEYFVHDIKSSVFELYVSL